MKKLSGSLKAAILCVTLCVLAAYFGALPLLADVLRTGYPEFSDRVWPWMGFLWGSVMPVCAALACCWCVAREIGKENAFSHRNARLLHAIACLAVFDSAYILLGDLVLFLLSMSHPSVALALLAVVLLGVSVAVAAEALSRLIRSATQLREENDLTV